MNGDKLVAEILTGREVVVISSDENADSAIFFADRNGEIYAFAKDTGVCSHGRDYVRLARHFERMTKNGQCILRGRPYKG